MWNKEIMMEGDRIKLIIVDDSQLTVVGLKTMFKDSEEVDVIGVAENGQLAISMVKELKPDLVLMDIGMPVMDGIQATRELKKLCPETKVIMLTSHDSESDVIDSMSAGAYSYCMKDIDPSLLMTVIRTTYSGASWLDPRIAQIVLKNFSNQPGKEEEIDLTEREVEILSLIAKGLSNNEISDKLFISLNTVKTHIKNIFQKMEVEDRTQAAMKAVKENIICE